jgi:hypothetical protein
MRDAIFHADRRGQPAEQDTISREDPPHLGHHGFELAGILREVEDCAADHRVEVVVSEREVCESADCKIRQRQTRRGFGRSSPDPFDLSWVGVDPEHVGATPHQVFGVATASTACVEQPHVRADTAPENLIEDINIDLTELSQQFVAPTGWL